MLQQQEVAAALQSDVWQKLRAVATFVALQYRDAAESVQVKQVQKQSRPQGGLYLTGVQKRNRLPRQHGAMLLPTELDIP